jgi:hypothetical protein
VIEFILNAAKRIGIEFTEYIYIKKVRVSEERARKRKTKPEPIQYDVNKILNYDHSKVFRLKECLDVPL